MEEEIATYLGPKGYSIKKANITIQEQELIRKELTVKAFAPKTSISQPTPFPVYRESPNKFYVPRHYGLKTYGEPDAIKIKEGDDINIPFAGDLRPFQKPIVNEYIESAKSKGGGLLEIHCGAGKCLGKGTPIMLANGSFINVEDVKVGDKLMGDDSTPRTVLSLARGREMMYDIIPNKGDIYTVNESHILSLKCSTNYSKKYKKGVIIDIGVRDYLKLPKTFHGRAGPLVGYRVPIIFPEKKVELDPYILGVWLGDGTSRFPAITSIYEPIINTFKIYCESLGLSIRQGKGRDNITYTATSGIKNMFKKNSNIMLNKLRKYNLIQNKHIPHVYKCNSREIQLQLLAGIIDTDGNLSHNGYDIIQKNETLLDDIIYIARSLGFAAYKKVCEKSCIYKGERKTGIYYRTSIYGKNIHEIPVKLERKKATPRRQIKDNLVTRIKVVQKNIDDYYGFEIDGNRRFVLGDFQVTHNTVMALKIISELKKKTLVIVHKEFLLQQWKERINQFLPTAQVGRIQGDIIDIEGKDIVIGMLQSLSMKKYPSSIFQNFGLTVVDECFPYKTFIHTEKGPICIGSLYEKWKNNEELPKILSFNRDANKFEYKKMTYSWRKESEELIRIKMSKKVINCTPEHKILTTKGYIKANALIKGSLIISKYDKNHIDNIISPALNEDQLQLVYGSFLGDGNIGITKKHRYRLNIIHCEKQKDYCEWKANMFGVKELKYIEKNGYSQKPAYRFHTKIFDLEDEIPKNTKIVPDWLLDKLDIRGIAIWYMDDGSINKRELKDGSISNYISIHSNNFDYEIQEKIVKKFAQYGINCTINKSKSKYYYLRFNKENSKKLLHLINPYIHVSMNYKINNREEMYNWNNNFLDYGLLKVTDISYFKNKGANRCKKPYVYDIEVEDNHNFVLGTKTKQTQNDYIDGPVVSNCHHIAAEVFSNALFQIVTKYMLGLSATVERKDRLTFVIKMFIGEVVYKKERDGSKDIVTVKGINYEIDDDEFSKVEYNFKGQVHYSKMIKKLCEFNRRSEFIIKLLEDSLKENPEQQFIVLAHNKNLLKYLHDAISDRKITSVGYYVGGMKQKDLKLSESKKVIIATYAMAEEALDIKSLTSLIMATPKSDVRQAVGRILRKKESKARVYDIIDMHGLFQRQWQKRCSWYRKQKFTIMSTNNENYLKNEWETISIKGSRVKKKKIVDETNNLLQGVCLVD